MTHIWFSNFQTRCPAPVPARSLASEGAWPRCRFVDPPPWPLKCLRCSAAKSCAAGAPEPFTKLFVFLQNFDNWKNLEHLAASSSSQLSTWSTLFFHFSCPAWLWKRCTWLRRLVVFAASNCCAVLRKVSKASWALRRDIVPWLVFAFHRQCVTNGGARMRKDFVTIQSILIARFRQSFT